MNVLLESASLNACGCDLLRMLAVFSVVISISGSVKYSDATHLPFSGPEREREREKEKSEKQSDEREVSGFSSGQKQYGNVSKPTKQTRNRDKGQTDRQTDRRRRDKQTKRFREKRTDGNERRETRDERDDEERERVKVEEKVN